jgi:hypothetical protein
MQCTCTLLINIDEGLVTLLHESPVPLVRAVQGLPLANSGGRNGHIEATKGLYTEIVPVCLVRLCWLCWIRSICWICRLCSPNVTCFRPDSATSRQGWVGAGAAPREELRWWFRDMWWSMRRGRGRGECRFLQSRDNNKDNSET